MAKFQNLTVELELQQAAFNKGMTDAAKQLSKIEQQSKKSTQALSSMEGGFKTLAAGAASLAAAFGAMKGLEAIVKAADDVRNLQASFTALLGDAGKAGDMMGKLLAIVDRTGAPLKETAESLQRLTIAMKPLGASNEQIALLAENFIKLGKVGGSSSEQVGNALTQLAQGLASGALGGDELKSIRENVPLVAQAIADGLGVPIGKLKELGEQGALTSDVVANAMLKATASIQTAFANMPVTFEQAANKMKAQAVLVTAEFDAAAGLSNTLVILTDSVANNLKRWHSELVVSRESLTQLQTLADVVSFTFKIIAAGAVTINFGLEQILKRMALWVQYAQALINLDWGAMDEALKRFNEQFDAAARQADQTIRDIMAGRTTPKAEPFGPPAPPGLIKPGAGAATGKGAGSADKEAEALRKRGEALAASVDPLNAYNQKVAEYNELLAKAAISSVTWSKAMEQAKETLTSQGDALTASVDPLFAYELELRKINQAYRDGQIEVETWVKLQEKAAAARDAAVKANEKQTPLGELLDQAAELTVSGIGDFFKDIINGSMSASEAFAKMVQTIITDLAKLLAEFAAKQAAKWILSSISFAGGGAAAASSAAPSMALASVPMTSWSPAGSLGLLASPTAAAGMVGGMTGAAPWQVTVNNYAPGVDVSTSRAPDGGLEITVARVRAALTQDVMRGGNPFSRSLEHTYGVGRGR